MPGREWSGWSDCHERTVRSILKKAIFSEDRHCECVCNQRTHALIFLEFISPWKKCLPKSFVPHSHVEALSNIPEKMQYFCRKCLLKDAENCKRKFALKERWFAFQSSTSESAHTNAFAASKNSSVASTWKITYIFFEKVEVQAKFGPNNRPFCQHHAIFYDASKFGYHRATVAIHPHLPSTERAVFGWAYLFPQVVEMQVATLKFTPHSSELFSAQASLTAGLSLWSTLVDNQNRNKQNWFRHHFLKLCVLGWVLAKCGQWWKSLMGVLCAFPNLKTLVCEWPPHFFFDVDASTRGERKMPVGDKQKYRARCLESQTTGPHQHPHPFPSHTVIFHLVDVCGGVYDLRGKVFSRCHLGLVVWTSRLTCL